MHRIYTTKGIILDDFSISETAKFYYIYTKDFGLIGATAQGVRMMKSKLRYNLSRSAYINLSLVRGRDVWRITSANGEITYSFLLKDDLQKRALLGRLLSFSRHVLSGEEKDEIIFTEIQQALDFLASEDAGTEDLRLIELLFKFRILALSGYMKEQPWKEEMMKREIWKKEELTRARKVQKEINQAVNKSLAESGLILL